jgi:pyruvate/2-oxoglutarate dehydrogenase complex dihydrolipoamide dehydrogenase (E3) component
MTSLMAAHHPKGSNGLQFQFFTFQFSICNPPEPAHALGNMSNGQTGFDYDVAIIGGGSGGYAAARTAVAAGLRAAVIEGGKEVGGLCILRGCMPTKALLYAAEVRHLAQYGGLWGMKPGDVPFDWGAVMARKDGLIREFADDRVQQLNSGKFQFIRGFARFTDPHTLALDNGQVLRAKHFVISTGSIVARPPLPQLSGVGYLTSDDALGLKKLPKSLIILGGGAVAVEFAQLFARFEVEVTLIQRSEQLLKDCDTDAAGAIEAVFRREGIKVLTGTRLVDAYRDGSLKAVTFLHGGRKTEVKGQEILFALGRSPNTASLNLDQAGVATDNGSVIANDRMRTNVSHIYTAGDCTGPHEIVHIAIQQGEVAAHNLAHPGQPRNMDYRLFISVVFTEPQIASVGLTEKTAAARGIPIIAASYPFNDHGKSLIMEARDGFVKLVADPKSGEILGGACVGPAGGELIHEIVAAMAKRMTVRELAAMPHYHPTLAEIWTYPAEELAERVAKK